MGTVLPSNAELIDLEYRAKKYDESNAPLYVSYPTSSYWTQTAGESRFFADLSAVRNPFLYFHFPFCENVCHYCMCYKVPGMTKDAVGRYVKAMTREIDLKSATWGRGDPITHIHWGGGTPTCLEADAIKRVFGTVARRFSVDVNGGGSISIEAYPSAATVTREKLAVLRRLGFNEISFGVQDLDERVQRTINRSCTFEEIKTVSDWSKREGFKVHIDLCSGLPFQELGGFENTMKSIVSLEPDRVAMLTYVHYPLLYENQRRIPASSIPNSFMRVMLSQLAGSVFSEAGYKKVGFDHFVRPDNVLFKAYQAGRVGRDLMGYSVGERTNFVGFGSSAISFLNGTFYHNAMTVDDYQRKLEENSLPLHAHNAYTLSTDDRIRNDIIQRSVLTYSRIDKKAIEGAYGIQFDEYFRDEMARMKVLEKDGLVDCRAPSEITVTPIGRNFSRHIASVFDRYYRKAVRKG
jgi:oxygen-independent coproporphyrinogen-3 oxidase